MSKQYSPLDYEVVVKIINSIGFEEGLKDYIVPSRMVPQIFGLFDPLDKKIIFSEISSRVIGRSTLVQYTLNRLIAGGLIEIEIQDTKDRCIQTNRGKVVRDRYYLTEKGREIPQLIDERYRLIEEQNEVTI